MMDPVGEALLQMFPDSWLCGTSLAHVDNKLEVWHADVWGSQQDCASEGLKEIPSKGPPEVHAQPQFRQAHRATRQRETTLFNR